MIWIENSTFMAHPLNFRQTNRKKKTQKDGILPILGKILFL